MFACFFFPDSPHSCPPLQFSATLFSNCTDCPEEGCRNQYTGSKLASITPIFPPCPLAGSSCPLFSVLSRGSPGLEDHDVTGAQGTLRSWSSPAVPRRPRGWCEREGRERGLMGQWRISLPSHPGTCGTGPVPLTCSGHSAGMCLACHSRAAWTGHQPHGCQHEGFWQKA